MPISVGYEGRARRVRLLARPNRFTAIVADRTGRRLEAHVPNPGRMEELLVPGATEGFVVPARGIARRTRFDLVAVEHGGALVSVDSLIANRLVAAVLERRPPTGLPRRGWRREVPWGHHRIDFGRHDGSGRVTHLLEVKSSNLRVGSIALFPDAPTTRGAAHLRALARAARSGVDATALFALQRDDVRAFAPNRVLDPEFARALASAARAGVRLLARRLCVVPQGVSWGVEVPILLAGLPERIK